ncbi:hypothetical protein D3C85_1542120 [compost metagenome]
MNDIESRQEPVFLDGDDESPQKLPLMVTRHTLRSRGLSKDLLKQLSAGATSDEPTQKPITTAKQH